VIPSIRGWNTLSLISVADAAKDDGYVMVGIPDGLGAIRGRFRAGRYVDRDDYMTVFMNHELTGPSGIPRAHGQTGAFVSQWTIRLSTLQVRHGEDLIQKLYTWDAGTSQYLLANGTLAAQLSRLCSADLPKYSAFYNRRTGKGFAGRLFMDGEENGSEGRGWAHVLTGDSKGSSYQLPYLGRMSFENTVASPNSGDKTVVISLEDGTPGQVYVYVGDKKRAGTPIERAGLSGGSLFGISVTNGGANYAGGPVGHENNGAVSGTFVLANVSAAALGSGAALQTASVAQHITEFARPEDGAWDTLNPRVFYFVITGATIDGKDQSSKLYKLTFDSIANPTGGKIEMVVDRASLVAGPPTPQPAALAPGEKVEPFFAQFDNITVDGKGFVMVQEDPGNVAYIARTWKVDPSTKVATEVLKSDPDRFLPVGSPVGTPPPFNKDEESSGIIDVTRLVRKAWWYEDGRRYFLADLQAHNALPPPYVEGGQLYLVASPRVHNGHHDDGDDHDRDDHHDDDHDRGDRHDRDDDYGDHGDHGDHGGRW
jgi:hypothetical protein